MKKLFYSFAILLISCCVHAQTQNVEVHTDFVAPWGNISAVDLNNSGNYDLFLAGRERPIDIGRGTILSYNATSQKYEVVDTTWKINERANIDWADIDGDGLIVAIAASHNFSDTAGVFKNLGNFKFQRLDYKFPNHPVSAAFGDFNRDGLMDYFVLSQDTMSTLYLNKGNGDFDSTGRELFGKYAYGLGHTRVIDINNDGLPDIYVSGNVDNKRVGNTDNARVNAEIYINQVEAPGTFKALGLKNKGVFMKANGGIDFADINGDGWLDMFIVGEGGDGTGEPVAPADVWACIPHVYINNKNNTFSATANFSGPMADIRPLNSSGQGARFLDWDNDGKMDLFVIGWNPTANPSATQAGYFLKGSGNGDFINPVRVPGGSESELGFIDWNMDGILDYVYSGQSWDATYFSDASSTSGRNLAIMTNPTVSKNVKPGAPSNLQFSLSGTNTVFTWNAGTDDTTDPKSLSYEYYLKQGSSFVVAPASYVGGEKDGLRKVLKIGNANLNKSIFFSNLADGEYTFGVQSIDNSYEGSPFTAVNIRITGGIPTAVKSVFNTEKPSVFPNPADKFITINTSNLVNVSITNLDGRVCKNVKISGGQINVSDLTSGVYFIKINDQGSTSTQKIVIKH